jgi:hypothetical protein
MPLSLPQLRRLAFEVARDVDPSLEVFATTNPEGAVDYTELILTVHNRGGEPGRIVVGINRGASESEIRNLLRAHLRVRLLELDDESIV